MGRVDYLEHECSFFSGGGESVQLFGKVGLVG